MTADVNVTEKVARALRKPDYIGCSCCAESDGLDYGADDPRAEGVARLALSALADPEVLAGMAGVLAEHLAATSYDAWDLHGCGCGWEVPDQGADGAWGFYRAHVATALADWIRGHR